MRRKYGRRSSRDPRRTIGDGIAWFVLLVTLPALSSCGGGAGSRSSTSVTYTVTIAAVAFQPADLTISLGDSVEWVNRDPFSHDATATSGSFESAEIEPEESFRFTPAAAGDYSYFCTRHPTMRAVVRVR